MDTWEGSGHCITSCAACLRDLKGEKYANPARQSIAILPNYWMQPSLTAFLISSIKQPLLKRAMRWLIIRSLALFEVMVGASPRARYTDTKPSRLC